MVITHSAAPVPLLYPTTTHHQSDAMDVYFSNLGVPVNPSALHANLLQSSVATASMLDALATLNNGFLL